ncbi:butyrophilin subfamily 1 member A1 [Pteronotus mesoamericanus]|uniref:butyrophilin subfamily 1 member A1 n=1 Tax=Pteronotus mesoamericanus TaxID=1884717 RepID=UPI0023ED37D5|nr:butyrophilin subfamily 1 member A1 [Pteronotus parnellii mesoamericanus]
MAALRRACLSGALLALLLLQLPRLPAAHLDVAARPEPILAMVGDDVELPCQLSPNANVSAAGAELRWLREQESPAVLVLRAGRPQDAEQTAHYRGRAASVQNGLALRLRGVRVSDDGEYRCLFRQDDSHGEASVRLKVAALGSDPHIHVEVQGNGEARLECTSVGWFPEPQARWRTAEGRDLPSASESRDPDEEGLFSVVTSVIVRDASTRNVSCCIQNVLLGQEKEAETSIPAPFFPRPTPWMVAVAVILTVLGILTTGSLFFTWRLYKERGRQRKNEFSSTEKLLEGLKWRNAALHAVDVTLDPDTAHPHLFLYEGFKSVWLGDARQELPEKAERFDSWPCVLGREAFTSGRHYWEVEVGDRTDWAIGVCREDVTKKGFDPMTPENGFWAVELYGNGYWALTPLRTPLSLAGPPRRVGIFLDYESGDVAFYNMIDGSLIYTFSGVSFSGPLRPFFCLWSCGKKPLAICPLTGGLEGVTVVADATDPSKGIPRSPMGEDAASGDTDMLHSKLISTQPRQAEP